MPAPAEAGEVAPAEAPEEPAEATTGEGEASVAPSSEEGEAVGRAATDLRLREIGAQVDALKEDTFSTKSRLLLLRESVLRRTISGSKVVVSHLNEMGSEYELVQLLYALDRQLKFNRLDYSGELDDLEAIVIDEQVVPGSHLLLVQMVFQGNSWGVFRYMDGYTFTIESSYAFTAEEGKGHEILVRAFEAGSFFTPIEERPSITYEMTAHDLGVEGPEVAIETD